MDKKTINELAYIVSTNDWDETNVIDRGVFRISQFQSTAFESDYQCFLISKLSKNGKSYLPFMVAKITDQNEWYVLKMLREHAYHVPMVVDKISNGTDKIMIFEEYIPGKELYQKSTPYNWRLTARSIARIHERFWNASGQPAHYLEAIPEQDRAPAEHLWTQKITHARQISSLKPEWENTFLRIYARLSSCPQTLTHGDFFPTNILMYGKIPYLIDWANAGEFPYFCDVGRITGVINQKTLRSFCPDIDSFLKEYYGILNQKRGFDYRTFLCDVWIGQFIEQAYYYRPPQNLGGQIIHDTSPYNLITEQLLDELSYKINDEK